MGLPPTPIPGAFVVASIATVGACVGAAMIPATRHALRDSTLSRTEYAILVTTTAITFALLAARFGPTTHIGAGLAMAVVGPSLAMVDVLERRLPTSLVTGGYVLAIAAVSVEAVSAETPALLGMAASSAIVVGIGYLGLALASRGGLGSGDVRMAGLVGLVLGTSGWTSVFVATVATWVLAAATTLAANTGRSRYAEEIPLGPFLAIGTIIGIVTS